MQMGELGEQKAATLALLGRLFPTVEAGQSLDRLEQAARAHIQVATGLA